VLAAPGKKMLSTEALADDPQSRERAKQLRRILPLVFGGLLALMIIAALVSLYSLRQLDDISRQAQERFAAHSQALSSIVVLVDVYDNQMARYLFQRKNATLAASVTDVVSRGTAVHTALLNYPADMDPEEKSMLQQIEREIVEQEASFNQTTAWRANERDRRAQEFMRDEILPRRTYILQVSRDMFTMNARRFGQATQSLAAQFRSAQMRLVSMVSLALVAGLSLSVVGGFYILRLEQQGRLRYRALVHSRQELEALSTRLVEAQEAERRSISRELHDEVGQTLGALLVDLGQLSKLVSPDDRLVQGQITRIKSAAETAVKSIRDIALLLRPPMLDDLGLIPALEWQGREVSRRSSMEVEVHSEGVSEQLPDELKVCVYRLVQEALNNAATHAEAKNAKVSVAQNAEKISMEIVDDGHGFDPGRMRGMGILGMEERVRRLGGSLSIQSAPGKGTAVRAELPVLVAHPH
jgi:signal transduction histidine kinase